MKKESKYAIVIDRIGGEFYPYPSYDDIERINKKVEYLTNYRKEHNMKERAYLIETLSKERLAQHTEEWTKWVSLID